ncbi:glycoside hydrolase superfamily [Biscogniauxia mediterranea]|nr:glycoside hydrolase superfamily [Biscogniauxia mediterranea]
MKATYAVAALTAGASAASVHHRHAQLHGLQKKAVDNSTCGCTTIYSTYYGEPTLIFPSVPAVPATSSSVPATSSSAAPTTTQVVVPVVPTPVPQVCPTTGVYTFPATTITLTESTTVCGATSTALPSGTHTIGGVTTVVTTATTVTCPVATVSTSEGVTTSVLTTTTYVCPEAGTYTIAPTTTTVPKDTTVNYPVVTSYPPGTYTQPEVVTTVTETSYTVYCPFDVPAATPSTTAVPVVTSAVATPSSPAPSNPAPSSSASASTSIPASSTSTASTPSSTGGLADSAPGKPAALTYTPYLSDVDGGCKSSSQVDSDISAIAAAGITHLRLYSTDCDTLTNVGASAKKYGLRLYVGIFIKGDGCTSSTSSIKTQIDAIKAWAQYDMVDVVFVGNEAGFEGYCSGQQLATLITDVKSQLGYSGPFSTADTVNTWQNTEFSGPICSVIDLVGCNSHPYFNEGTSPSEAGEFVSSQLDICKAICSGKDAFVTETGWPTAGAAHGLAVPGVAEQKIAIDSMLSILPSKVTLLSLTNDLWKGPGEDAWGCASALGIKLTTSS